MANEARSAELAIFHLIISNKQEWNNFFILKENYQQILLYLPDSILQKRPGGNFSSMVHWLIIPCFYFLGSPAPPSKLDVTDIDCIEGTLKLSWIPGASNGAPIEYYLIEEESSSDPGDFTFVFNVTNPHATEAALKLSGTSVPRLRMKAVNKFGTSLPSLPTAEQVCGTTRATEGR